MTTVLVTGGCGFIGGHFIRLVLARTGWRVVNLDSLTYAAVHDRAVFPSNDTRYRFIRGDISDRALLRSVFQEEHPWAVVNFAAESHVDRSIVDATPFLATNVVGVQALLDAARLYPVERFVQISTDEVYGEVPEGVCASEESPLRPSSPYAASKAAGDLICQAYRRTYGVPILITRSSNNYGPWQFPEKLIPLAIRNAFAGKALPLYGDGQHRRDWVYVGDNSEGILAVLERGVIGSVYNVATGQERTNLDVVQTVGRVLTDELRHTSSAAAADICFAPERPGHDRRYAADAAKIRRELSWSPRIGFEDGIVQTVRWYVRHRRWLERLNSDACAHDYAAVYAHHWRRRIE